MAKVKLPDLIPPRIADAQRLQIAQAVLLNLSPDQSYCLECLIRAKLQNLMMFGHLPQASGYGILPELEDDDTLQLAVELLDAQGRIVAGPYCIAPFPVGI